jgi:hypothetical protein
MLRWEPKRPTYYRWSCQRNAVLEIMGVADTGCSSSFSSTSLISLCHHCLLKLALAFRAVVVMWKIHHLAGCTGSSMLGPGYQILSLCSSSDRLFHYPLIVSLAEPILLWKNMYQRFIGAARSRRLSVVKANLAFSIILYTCLQPPLLHGLHLFPHRV